MISFLRSFFRPSEGLTSETTSTLSPGFILRGAKWDYRILEPMNGDSTHGSIVYKAKVEPHEDDINAPQWAVIKVAHDENTKQSMGRELAFYSLPNVASRQCFRQLYDVIDDDTIALEWLDTTLQDVEYQPDLSTYILIEEVLRVALTSAAILGNLGHVNADYKPANILISRADNGRVTAKVGDFGQVYPTGVHTKVQPYAMRAPEIFKDQTCTERSQVWAIAAMVLVWMNPDLLGVGDCPHSAIDESWCRMKMKLLFPDQVHFADYDYIQQLFSLIVPGFVKAQPKLEAIFTFEEETEVLGVPQEIRDVLRLMFVVDKDQRPSASSVLDSAEFEALEKFVEI
ncbi:kinase-like domain-containing protein [Rostrohypoxylon terebratum]|nr:kinase-like domain-containing protein [Rostrohypoxylon terebratum]